MSFIIARGFYGYPENGIRYYSTTGFIRVIHMSEHIDITRSDMKIFTDRDEADAALSDNDLSDIQHSGHVVMSMDQMYMKWPWLLIDSIMNM